ncbi:hypothetical protein BHF71_05160 [Vulcanibacillus modesticaldus]|uniref:Peptide ABC transporter permease n=1 Tax=Vulcanibacillus modesticaldus TaxID=337097 RepID=A0A1D2YX57_9BACI|nr:anti-sigma-F factor Fin [Vulcanibacillus modesticaldus]OEG00294.1 hypothetical protein BHF71_05160 [Vulcanibacillus modesticaldus]
MLRYVCKYCGQNLGRIDLNQVDEVRLGLQSLTPLELKSIITFELNGDMTANIICEYCQEALEKNPELSLISNPLQ